jgi:hypothetical protein
MLNPSVRLHLRSIVDAERARTSRFLVRLRAVITVLYLGIVVWYALVQQLPDWKMTLPIFALHAFLSVALALLVERSALVLRYSGLSVGLLDMPMISLASLAALGSMARPEYLLGSLLPVLALGIVLASLSLDFWSIGLATVMASASSLTLVLALDAPPSELVAPLFATITTGVLSAFLVSRLRSLVAESRRKDFAGKYLLGERIGVGGMAEVFTATYSPEGGFERRVAVKRVLAQFSEREEFVALFRREAELGAQLAHPNLVQVLDFGRHLESWFLAMEFVDGVSLQGLIKSLGRKGEQLPVAACLYVLCEVAQGLAYLHEKRSSDGARVGLVHRDLNPPNVLLSTIGEVKLSDYGVARWQSSSELTVEGTLRGKLAYMAPEQVEGGSPTLAWDLFALGVTAHETLTGQRLFKGPGEVELLRAVLDSHVAPPSQLRPGLAPQVDALVMALLERDPARRLASARLVVDALRSIQGPEAPYPVGQAALIHAIAGAERTAPAQAPSSPASDPVATITLPNR